MKLAHSLYLETLALVLLYLAALIAVAFIVFNTHFGAGWDALMQSPLGDKVDTVADAVNNQLRSSPEKKWNEVLELFGGLYHVKFTVFDLDGHQIAGEKIELPEAVLDQFALPMMPPHFRTGIGPPPPPFAGGRMETFEIQSGPGERREFHAFGGGPEFGPGGPDFEQGGPNFEHRGPGHPQLLGLHVLKNRVDTVFPHLSITGHGRRLFSSGDTMFFPAMPAGVAHVMRFDDHSGLHLPMPVRLPMPAHGRFLIHTTKPDHFFFGTRIDLQSDSYFRPGPSVLVASADNIWQTGLLLDFKVLAMAVAAIALLSIVFWLPFIYRITRALSDLTLATERIAEGKFDTRLQTKRKDEIGRLSEAVNSMAERLNGFVGGQKRFLADISHELFSPLARLQVALEILDGSSTRDQKALIDDIREEVEEMNHLINELIAFSKAELKGQSRQLGSVDIDEMFCELVDRLSLKSRAEIEIADGLCVVGDRLLLERSFSNVLRNSVRYAGDKGPISIKAAVAGNDVSILIQDRGPGVPKEALKHLAEPFFRPEPSRSRESGGVGLGLAIVKSCVEACGGKLEVRNRDGGGLEVEVTLRLSQNIEPAVSEASIEVS